ncbi:MAG: ABC transporter permease [Flavobacteriales bacterium]|nr:ABC transporter permease [Flavobacteriales bacterium]
MGKYLLKRILVFFPTLVVITLLGFILSINMPGDPVDRLMTTAQSTGDLVQASGNMEAQKREWRKKLGLDLPVFYFSLHNLATPDTIHRIYDPSHRQALERLIHQYGNWPQIVEFHEALKAFVAMHSRVSLNPGDTMTEEVNQLRFESLSLLSTYDTDVLETRINNMATRYQGHPALHALSSQINVIQERFREMKEKATPWKLYVPTLSFHLHNQYHRWIFGDGNWITGKDAKFSKGLIRGDFGLSFATKQPISAAIGSKIWWSLLFTVLSVILAYVVSIPIGIRAASKPHSRFDRITTVILFVLYSMPSFWFATLLLMTFANPDVLPIFPASGVKPATGFPEGAGFFQQLRITLPYLVLPLTCYTYSSFAFLSRTMRVAMIEAIDMDYIRTARAKGLTKRKVIYKHAFRNALLPIITIFTNIFPYAIGGSIILETIFTLPGMGLEMYMAIGNKDHPTIIAILTLSGALTLIGFLLADILYAIADPRISYGKR